MPYLLHELNHSPELAFQKGYLARVLHPRTTARSTTRASCRSRSSSTATATASPSRSSSTREETIRPVVYVRRDGVLREEALPPHPLRRYEGRTYLEALEKLLRPLLG